MPPIATLGLKTGNSQRKTQNFQRKTRDYWRKSTRLSEEKYKKGLFVTPIWKREKRPDFLDAKKGKKQPNISMKWKYTK